MKRNNNPPTEKSKFELVEESITKAQIFCSKQLPEFQISSAATFFSPLLFPNIESPASQQEQRFGYGITPSDKACTGGKLYQLIEFSYQKLTGVIRERDYMWSHKTPLYDWMYHPSYYIHLQPDGEYKFLEDGKPVELDMKLTDILNITKLQPVQSLRFI